MLLLELLLVPLPPEVTERVERYAIALGVDDQMLRVTRRIAKRLARSRADRLRAQRILREDARTAARASPHRGRFLRLVHGTASATTCAARRSWSALGACPMVRSGHGVRPVLRRAGSRSGLRQARSRLDPRAGRPHGLPVGRRCSASSARTHGPGRIFVARHGARSVRDGYLFAEHDFFENDRGVADCVANMSKLRLAGDGGELRYGRPQRRDRLMAIDWFQYADWPLEDVRRTRCPREVRGGGGGGFGNAVGARRHLTVPVPQHRARSQSPKPSPTTPTAPRPPP